MATDLLTDCAAKLQYRVSNAIQEVIFDLLAAAGASYCMAWAVKFFLLEVSKETATLLQATFYECPTRSNILLGKTSTP